MPESSVHQDCAPITPPPPSKRPSGAEQRKRRVANGLPRNSPSDVQYIRRRRREYRRKRIAANQAYVTAVKLERGCADCGYRDHPAALEFDHLPGFEKLMDLARFSSRANATREKLDAEMAKCDVVCANCHRIRTWLRKQESSD